MGLIAAYMQKTRIKKENGKNFQFNFQEQAIGSFMVRIIIALFEDNKKHETPWNRIFKDIVSGSKPTVYFIEWLIN